MVQRKVSSNKLGIQANTIIKNEIRQAIIAKPNIQNNEIKSKGADLKAKKMKKSRSIKRGDVDFTSLHSSSSYMKSHEVVQQQGEEVPIVVTPTKTPSPKKMLSPCKNKCLFASPNYMKSTSSSEARKEKETKVISTTLLHRARQTLGKSSSFKKVRTLTKAPTFKHTRAGVNKKGVVLCEDDVDVQRATCSSTLKDSKFPAYLKLKPGATEAQGTSVMKVCPYTYCSLNGHHHKSAPPLKYFLSSRRKSLKTQKNYKPEITSPRKRNPSEIKVNTDGSEMGVIFTGVSEMPESPKREFFVEIYAPGSELSVGEDDVFMERDPVQVSEHFSEGTGPCSEIDFQDGGNDQSFDGRALSEFSVDSQGTPGEDSPVATDESSGVESDQEADTASSVSLDQFFGERSDMEWEEANIPASQDEKADISVHSDCGNNEDDCGFDLEFLAWKLLPHIPDEVMECLLYSDVDSSSDSEFSQTDEEQIEEQLSDEEVSIDEGVTENQNEGLEPVEEANGANGDFSDEESYVGKEATEGDSSDTGMEDGTSDDCTIEDVVVAAEEGQADVDDSEAVKSADLGMGITAGSPQAGEESPVEQHVAASATVSETDHETNEVKFRSIENDIGEIIELSETEDNGKIEEETATINSKNETQKTQKYFPERRDDSGEEFLNCCDISRRSKGCKKADEESEDEKDFNPRPPNFLPVVPDPDAEKVDLRHQELDERRNSEEWMLDYALQKTVNQLAPARKKKVALLVEAFEAVLPIPKYEPRPRRNSSAFELVRPIQACS